MSEQEILTQRVQRLERRSVVYRWALILTVILFGLVLMLEKRAERNQLDVMQLNLVDQTGHILAHFGADRTDTCLDISGKSELSFMRFCAGKGGSTIDLYDRQTASRVVLTAGGNGIGRLGRVNESGVEKPTEIKDAKTYSGLFVEDEMNKTVFDASVGANSSLLVGHISEKNSLVLSIDNDLPRMSITDENANPAWETSSNGRVARGQRIRKRLSLGPQASVPLLNNEIQ